MLRFFSKLLPEQWFHSRKICRDQKGRDRSECLCYENSRWETKDGRNLYEGSLECQNLSLKRRLLQIQLLSHKNLLLQRLIDTGSKGTRLKLHHTTAILPTSQMSTDEPNDLSLALAISGGGDPRHPLRGTPLLHIKFSDAVLKNLILGTDGINFTRMR